MEFKRYIYSSTHHFPIAAWESCQRFVVIKSGLKIQVLDSKMLQMISRLIMDTMRNFRNGPEGG